MNPTVPVHLQRGTPEHKAYLARIGGKGGRSTHSKHPGHLKEIAAAGGRALAKKGPEAKKRKKKPSTEHAHVVRVRDGNILKVKHGTGNALALGSLDEILKMIEPEPVKPPEVTPW